MQSRAALLQHLSPPIAIGPIVPGQQAQSNSRRIDALGAQARHQNQVAAALGHLVPVPADHARMHVMSGESPFAADGFGGAGSELVMRKDQVAATTLDVQAAADAAG